MAHKAFPCQEIIVNTEFPSKPGGFMQKDRIINHTGMDLRDYFAAKAMQVAAYNYGGTDANVIAHLAYELADSMMEKRKHGDKE